MNEIAQEEKLHVPLLAIRHANGEANSKVRSTVSANGDFEQQRRQSNDENLKNSNAMNYNAAKAVTEFNIADTCIFHHSHTWPTPLSDAAIPSSKQLAPMPQSTKQIKDEVYATGHIQIRCVTWNQQAKDPTTVAELVKHLIPRGRYHVICVCTQECENTFSKSIWNPAKTKWKAALAEVVGLVEENEQHGGECTGDYELVRCHALQTSHIALYVHKAISHLVSDVNSHAVPTGVYDTFGNKGGIGIALSIGSSTFCFLNAHLAAHQGELDRRTYEFLKISNNVAENLGRRSLSSMATAYRQKFRRENVSEKDNSDSVHYASQSSDCCGQCGNNYACFCHRPSLLQRKNLLAESFQYVFWAGDLNFRINGTREIIDDLLARNAHRVLFNNDQLNMLLQFDPAFVGFSEGPLYFRPTYKFDHGSDCYDTSNKRRIPAWTDRILFKADSNVELLSYCSAPDVRTSDHRPVYATFRVKLNLQNCTGFLSNADLHLADASMWQTQSKSEICTLM